MPEDRAKAEALLAERQAARAARDFVRADALRERIDELGFVVRDTPSGPQLEPRPAIHSVDPGEVPLEPVSLAATVHVLYEGYLDDLGRFVDGMSSGSLTAEILITDNASSEGAGLDGMSSERVRVQHFTREVGWAAARNAGARAARGGILVFADLSVEPTGDVIGPLVATLSDPGVGVCGPWGLRSENMRDFTESAGPEVDAIEGYLLAVRREDFFSTGFDPWFTWYRHADLDLSFRIRSLGLSALVTDVPAVRHTHRGWAGIAEPERTRRSRRNFYRFLDRWKDRLDLLTGGYSA